MDSDGAGWLSVIVIVGLLATHYAGNRNDASGPETTTTNVSSVERADQRPPADRGPAADRAAEGRAPTPDDQTVVTIGTDVLFEFGTAQLTPTGAGRIAEVATNAPKQADVQVNGHTDSVGSASANQRLSEQRAQAVATAISTARSDLKLDIEGFGESRPVADNTRNGRDYPQGRERNRRVEIRY